MDRHLAKTYTCTCGHEKIIVWLDALRFCMGYNDSCIGHSTCEKCGLTQAHYSGSPDGAQDFFQQMEEIDFLNNPDIEKH